MNGKFPIIDFQKGTQLVSVKTVDLTSPTWKNRVSKYVDQLANSKGYVGKATADGVVDYVEGEFALDLFVKKADKHLIDENFIDSLATKRKLKIRVEAF